MLHPSYIGDSVKALNQIRGDLNPHLGFGHLVPMLFGSKVLENKVANAIWSGVMPQNKSYIELVAASAVPESVQHKRLEIRKRLEVSLSERRKLSPTEIEEIRSLVIKCVIEFMQMSQQKFEKGAFIKNYGETTTGDLGTQIMSFNYNAINIANQFMNRFLSSHNSGATYEAEAFQKAMNSEFYETGSRFFNQFLLHPDSILIQERVLLEKTDLGFPLEVRVDFIDGEPVFARPRYTHEYLGKDLENAKKLIDEFFKRCPEQLRYLSGGADVVKLQDGTWKIIELNVGANSGTGLPGLLPILSNQFYSALTQKPTPLIQLLESKYLAGSQIQNQYLKSLKVEIEKWKKDSIDDLSVAEVARWLRDRSLEDFDKNPTSENAKILLDNLKFAFQGIGGANNRDLPLLIRGFENHVQKSLITKPANPSPKNTQNNYLEIYPNAA